MCEQPGSVSPNENICGERYRAASYLVGHTCWRRIRSVLHIFLWNEKHQGAIPDYHYPHGHDHVDFVFDLRARPSLYRGKQSEFGTFEAGDSYSATGMSNPVRPHSKLGQILNAASSLSAFLCAWSWPFCAAPLCSSICTFRAKPLLVMTWSVYRAWLRGQRRQPFAVSLTLQAYTNNSYLNFELDSPATPLLLQDGFRQQRPRARRSKPVRLSRR